MRVSRYNNFRREINEMQMSGVSITTCVTCVWHDFEKLNLYVVPMLLSILRRSEIYFVYVLQKEGKNKTCSYYLYDYIHFLEKKKSISKQRLHCHLHSVPDITSEMDI